MGKNNNKIILLQERLQKNPVWCAKVILEQIFYWRKQREITHSVWNNRYTIVKSTTGTGKTFCAATIAVLFANLFRPSITTIVAPRWKIINEQLFEEIRKIYNRHGRKLLGKPKAIPHLKLGDKHFITGFSAKSTKSASIEDLLTGLHAPYQLNIFDQSCGLSKEFYKAVLGLMDSDFARCLFISNPFNKSSEFGRIWYNKSKIIKNANKISINAFDNPNVKYKRTIIPGMSSYIKFKEMCSNWAKDDPLYLLHVLGEFVEEYFKILITETLFQNLKVNDTDPDFSDISIGLDIADEGDDKTVWVVRAGVRTLLIRKFSGSNYLKTCDITEEIIDYLYSIFNIKLSRYDININVDATTPGKAIYDLLIDRGYNAHKIKSQRAVPAVLGKDEVEDFINFRSYLGFMFRKFAYNKEINIIPIDKFKESYINEFEEECQIRYMYSDSGRVKLDAKDNFKKEINRSPDIFDAFCLAFIPSNEEVFNFFDVELKKNINYNAMLDEESYEDYFNDDDETRFWESFR